MRSPWATPLDRLPSDTPDEGGIGGFIAGAKVLADRFEREPGEIEVSDFSKCPICGKLFYLSIDLSDHIKRAHAPEVE